ncbi:hypothetical protein [Bartonella queenslandensis]|nr:hypothetical protein [Bartonella queenslandensis]
MFLKEEGLEGEAVGRAERLGATARRCIVDWDGILSLRVRGSP